MDNKKNINVEFTQEDEQVVIVSDELPRVEFDIEDDPLEETYKIKLEILQAERILERQNSTPTINFSIQPNWTLETTKQAALNFYKNGASKELIYKSLNISEEKLEEILNNNKE